MNKQTIEKARLFLSGIMGRLEEGADFFEGIDVTFSAGTKGFFLKAALETDGGDGRTLWFLFCGERIRLEAGAFTDFLAGKMQDYDAMRFVYHERGRKLIVEANGRDVKTRTERSSGQPQADTADADTAPHVTGTAVMGNREYFIKAGEAAGLLTVLGIMGKNGKSGTTGSANTTRSIILSSFCTRSLSRSAGRETGGMRCTFWTARAGNRIFPSC